MHAKGCGPCAGDSTANLMWRLQNGEAPQGLRAGALVLHIGSSDLTYASFQVHIISSLLFSMGHCAIHDRRHLQACWVVLCPLCSCRSLLSRACHLSARMF